METTPTSQRCAVTGQVIVRTGRYTRDEQKYDYTLLADGRCWEEWIYKGHDRSRPNISPRLLMQIPGYAVEVFN